jgi:hypothetical protein
VAPGLGAACALAIGRACWRDGRPGDARPHLERTLADADGGEDEELAIVAGIVLGWVLAELDELARAESVLAEASARANARGDRLHEAAALNNRAFVLWKRGALDALPDLYHRVVAIGRELGMPTHEYRAHAWMLEVLTATGATSEVQECEARMSELEAVFPELFSRRIS